MQKIEIKDIQELENILRENDVDFSKWGKFYKGMLKYLFKQIEIGESVFYKTKDNNLLRKTKVSVANVYYKKENKKYKLKEKEQIFFNFKKQAKKHKSSISETARPNEHPKECILRGLKEELGIKSEVVLKQIDQEKIIEESFSFPTVKTEREVTRFDVFLNDSQYKKRGYVDVEANIKSIFVWEEI